MQAYHFRITSGNFIESAIYVPDTSLITPTTQKILVLSGEEDKIQRAFLYTAHNLFYSNEPICLAMCNRVAYGLYIDDEKFDRIKIQSRLILPDDLHEKALLVAVEYQLAARYHRQTKEEIDAVSNTLLEFLN
ncbi:MAG: hypothetical protein ABIJ34_02875 [archaeon]